MAFSRETIEQIAPIASLDAAIEWQAENPGGRLIVAAGFDPLDLERITASKINQAGEPIIVNRDLAGSSAVISRLCGTGQPRISLTEEVFPEIRSALEQAGAESGPAVRYLSDPKEVKAYLRLRYKVWRQMGYIAEERQPDRANLEIDHIDRTAIPLGAFTAAGQLVGCARLIRNFGKENREFVRIVETLIDESGDPVLGRSFAVPQRPHHPFDVLEQFEGFQCIYRTLQQRGVPIGEVGRVIVDPNHRGQGLASRLVHGVIDLAQQNGLEYLFLACSEEMRGLYQRCGFQAIDGLRSDRFFNINQASIVMERRM